MKNLISLKEHNSRNLFEYNNVKSGNGIACPNCGKELYDTHSNVLWMTHMPKQDIHCKNCNYVGTRF